LVRTDLIHIPPHFVWETMFEVECNVAGEVVWKDTTPMKKKRRVFEAKDATREEIVAWLQSEGFYMKGHDSGAAQAEAAEPVKADEAA
jgi:hypothetical protein